MKKQFVILTGLCLLLTACSDLCGNEAKQESVSPDGQFTATAFIRDCGATTDFSPQVYLRRTGKKMAEKGNVFIADHSDQISIRWLSSKELEIFSPGQVVLASQEFEGIKITIKP